jgi:hypothetical protein
MDQLPSISDEFMRNTLPTAQNYTAVILKHGPAYDPPASNPIIWEHGRRNFALRQAGLLSIVCPISDGTEIAGLGIFDAPPSEVERLLEGDPAIRAGVLVFELHPARGFPGDSLPATGDGLGSHA